MKADKTEFDRNNAEYMAHTARMKTVKRAVVLGMVSRALAAVINTVVILLTR